MDNQAYGQADNKLESKTEGLLNDLEKNLERLMNDINPILMPDLPETEAKNPEQSDTRINMRLKGLNARFAKILSRISI